MQHINRRKFITSSTVIAAGIAVANPFSSYTSPAEIVPCSAGASPVAGTISSVRNGNWSDAGTWGGRVPGVSDTPDVKHEVVLDINASTSGCNISGTLTFSGSPTFVCTKNIVVTGTLTMRPSPSQMHTIRFTGINDASFKGGGMDVLPSDTGLWIMGSGKLDLIGTFKTPWANVTITVPKGSSQTSVTDTTGWQPGDQYAITPTGNNDMNFSSGTILGVAGSAVNISSTQNSHSAVDKWKPEILNLTRNVRIEGTEQGRSHVFIRSSAPQTIKYASFRHMGPRKDIDSDGITEIVLGRYGLHFHHCMDIYGSVVEGCVIQDANSHAYVPHVSNGITFKNCIAYNTKESAFWWDEGEVSHDIVYDSCVAAKCSFVNHSLAVDTTSPTDPSFGTSAFMLGMGDDNICRKCVVAGCDTGDAGNGGGYMWQANNEGVWIFESNLAHNCPNGAFIWQNSPLNHVLVNTDIYHCSTAITHGAYANSYTFRGGNIHGCSFNVEASSQDTARVRLENIVFNGAGLVDYSVIIISSPIPGSYPVFIRGCHFTGQRIAGVVDVAAKELKSIDLVQCTSTGTLVSNRGTSQEVVRYQWMNGEAYSLSNTGKTTIIPMFAPSVWGSGTGLKAEYFNDKTMQGSPVVTRVDSNIAFQQWSTSLHHRLPMASHSMRWSGKIQAQFTSIYTFVVAVNGGVRVWINGVQIIDKWQDQRDAQITSTPVNFTQGQLYDIRIEYFNSDSISGILFLWQCTSLPLELVPQSQLFPADVVVPPVVPPTPPVNPTATLTLTVTPISTRSNWSIKVSSSAGGKIKLSVKNSSGAVIATADVDSGQTIVYGSGVTRGTYTLYATQGTQTKSISIVKR